MKSILKTLIVIIFSLGSCNEPETVVTDIVRADGSIERRIEMKGANMKFGYNEVQVPYDSTWKIRDSLEINKHGDTLRVRRAVKIFSGTDELNKYYNSDSSLNRDAKRKVEFRKKFKWFSTSYTFSEIVENRIQNGYPVASFLSDEEQKWFYMPDVEKKLLLAGPDSLKYMTLDDSVNAHSEVWIYRSIISEWLNIFNELTGGKILAGDIKRAEDNFFNILKQNPRDFDILWKQGIIQGQVLGEKYGKEFREEADSAMNAVEDLLGQTFSSYTVRIIMPGKTISHNGLPDSTGVPQWQVKSEYFFTEPYVMKAESITNNAWAWIITTTFIILLAGAALYPLKKHNPAL